MSDLTAQGGWITSWGASTSGFQGGYAGPDATIRQTMRLSAGGRTLRMRFVNPHSYAPLALRAVSVALADAASAGLLSAPRRVTVAGAESFEVHPGAVVYTDPIPLVVEDLATVAVSVHVDAPVAMSSHDWANRVLWGTLGNVGDRTMDTSPDAFRPIGFSWLWVDAVDVLEPDAAGAIVALGDSITDGAGSDFGTDSRWPDLLADRLLALPAGDPRRRAVVNAAIGGNTVGGFGSELAGINALSRLDRDALSLSGVTEVVVSGGSNDLFLGAPSERLTADLTTLATRIRAGGARPIVATLAPRVGGYQWSEESERRRQQVNGWIRRQSVFDAVLDFDSVLADPQASGRILPDYDADGTHPNTAGYLALAASVDLDTFSGAAAQSVAPETFS